MPTTSEKVNATSLMITKMASDPAEKLGIAVTLVEIFRYELTKIFANIAVDPEKKDEAKDEQKEQ